MDWIIAVLSIGLWMENAFQVSAAAAGLSDTNGLQGGHEHHQHGGDMTTPAMDHTMGDDHMHGDMGGMGGGMMMQMSFYAGSKATILFKSWSLDTWQGMLGSCIGIAIIAALFEGFKVGRELLMKKAMFSHQRKSTKSSKEAFSMNNKGFQSGYGSTDTHIDSQVQGISSSYDLEKGIIQESDSSSMWDGYHWLQTVLYVTQMFVSYCLMLIVMSYNVYLFIAVLIGTGLGHLLFKPLSDSMDTSDHH